MFIVIDIRKKKNKYQLPWWLSGKESTFSAGDMETLVQSLGQEESLKKEMATHSSILAWEIPGQRSLGRGRL